MDSRLQQLFLFQIMNQCQFVIKASGELDAALERSDTVAAFYSIQNLLSASANVAKALWGEGGRLATQRQVLRDRIGVDDKSPLKSPTMRNNFDHFDERLERWWDQSKEQSYVDLCISDRPDFGGLPQSDTFRLLDKTTMTLTFWGQEFSLRDLVSETQRILPIVTRETLSRFH
jgi:hypothetical protein